jgi:IS5 family transposase
MAAEIVLRLLVLKHVRNWSYEVLEREVRANLVYRDFTCVGGGKVPDAKTMGRWGMAVGPQVLERIHARIVTIARERGVVAGAWIQRSWRPTFIIRPIRACWGMGSGC